MATPREMNSNVTHNLVDDFESAFQNCITLLTAQEHFNVQDSEETKAGVENSVQRFLESARQMDAYFLTKRLELSVAKPEHVLTEDIAELKTELERKDRLIEKHHEKLQKWQALVHSNQPIIPTTTPSSPYPGTPMGHPPGMAQNISMQPSGSSGPPMAVPTQTQNMMSQQQGNATLPQGQYPGPPAGHPGQYIMPPPAYPQGPLAYLERM